MSDMYGIEDGVKGALNIYFAGSRGNGRTLAMINNLKPGDRVVFTTHSEARRVEGLCKERKVEGVQFIVLSPKTPERVFEYPTAKGRTIFDHRWVEKYYINAINRAAVNICNLQIQSSGYGEAHFETKLKAREKSKWSSFT